MSGLTIKSTLASALAGALLPVLFAPHADLGKVLRCALAGVAICWAVRELLKVFSDLARML